MTKKSLFAKVLATALTVSLSFGAIMPVYAADPNGNPVVVTDGEGKDFNLHGAEAVYDIVNGVGCFERNRDAFLQYADYNKGLIEFGQLGTRPDGNYGFYPYAAPVHSYEIEHSVFGTQASYWKSPTSFKTNFGSQGEVDMDFTKATVLPSSYDWHTGVARIGGHRDVSVIGTVIPKFKVGDILIERNCSDLNVHIDTKGQTFASYDNVFYEDWVCVAAYNDLDGVIDNNGVYMYNGRRLADIAIEYAAKYGLSNEDVIVAGTCIAADYYFAPGYDKRARNCKIFIRIPESVRFYATQPYTRTTALDVK